MAPFVLRLALTMRWHTLTAILLCISCSDSMDADFAENTGNSESADPSFMPGATSTTSPNGVGSPVFGEDIAGIPQPGAVPGMAGTPTGVPVVVPPPLPPEVEQDFEFELPHSGQRYVYAVNPDTDTVAVIDANSLAIQSVEAGDEPRFLQTLAGTDAAVVLNAGSADATVIRTANGKSTTTTVSVQAGTNAIAVAPDGKHAVVYFDAEQRSAGTSGSYQDVSILFLGDGKDRSIAMTVGFRPSKVSFSDDGKFAHVVTEDGVSILDFAEIEDKGSHIARTVGISDDAKLLSDVSITSDGAYALARRENESTLRLIDLDSGDIATLDLATLQAPSDDEAPMFELDGGAPDADAGAAIEPATPAVPATPVINAPVTDLDLAPSGTFALAVLRNAGKVVELAIPGSFTSGKPSNVFSLDQQIVGSVSIAPDSKKALLYTTAVDNAERMIVLDVESADTQLIKLPKAIASVTIAEDSETAFIVHKKLEGDPNQAGIDPDTALDRAYGYSVFDFETGFSKLQTSTTQVGPSTVVPDGSNLFVLFNDPALSLREVHQVDLTSFVIEHIALGSPPTSIGAVADTHKVFVGQEHPDGRIAFIDWTSGELESVTGFELNSRIRE